MYPDEFQFNTVTVRRVPDGRYPDKAFYISCNGGYGIRMYPSGKKVLIKALKVGRPGRKQKYNLFRHAYGRQKGILAATAVFLAWNGRILPGMTIDHIDGNTQNNDFRNLRQVDMKTNQRDGGFLTKLRHKGIDPTKISVPNLLRFYSRMAKYKSTHSKYKYRHLTKHDLILMLFFDYDYEC